MGRLKKMILGEKMPDKNDPEYREKYEKDVEAGRKFAKATRLDRLAGHIQRFAATASFSLPSSSALSRPASPSICII